MSMMKIPSQLQIKALRELGDIGAAHAVTGVSKLLNQKVDISVTNMEILPINEIREVFETPETMVTVTCFDGDSKTMVGDMYLVFHQREASRLIKLITGNPISGSQVEDEYELSVLKEVGNIMCACYIHTLSTVLNKKILHTVPEIKQDIFAAVMSGTPKDDSDPLNHAVMLDTQFELTNGDINGTMFFVLTSSCMDEIFDAIEQE